MYEVLQFNIHCFGTCYYNCSEETALADEAVSSIITIRSSTP